MMSSGYGTSSEGIRVDNRAEINRQHRNLVSTEQLGLQLCAQLGELFSREEKKSIPTYEGESDDLVAKEWLAIAERVARNNSWTDEQKIRFFSDRLRLEAVDWHMNNYEGGNPTYSVWKKSFLKRFHDEADIERLRTKLTQLKQHADQRARAYVARLDSLYIAINGKDIVLNEGADANSKRVTNIIIKMRDKERMNILLRGLLPKLKTEVWRRISLNPDYKILCNTVYESEGILLSQDFP